jgi:hypothetical protein
MLVEGLAVHRVLQRLQLLAEPRPLFGRELADDRLVVPSEDRLGLVEQRAGTLEGPRRRDGRSGRSGGCAWIANGNWWRAAQSAISKIVKRTMPTGTGCALTSDWIAPKPPESSVPLGGVSAQTRTDARTIGKMTNQTAQ